MKSRIFIINLILLISLQVLFSAENINNNQSAVIEVVDFKGIQYISAIDYSNQSKMKYIFIENKEKLIIQYTSNKIIVSLVVSRVIWLLAIVE